MQFLLGVWTAVRDTATAENITAAAQTAAALAALWAALIARAAVKEWKNQHRTTARLDASVSLLSACRRAYSAIDDTRSIASGWRLFLVPPETNESLATISTWAGMPDTRPFTPTARSLAKSTASDLLARNGRAIEALAATREPLDHARLFLEADAEKIEEAVSRLLRHCNVVTECVSKAVAQGLHAVEDESTRSFTWALTHAEQAAAFNSTSAGKEATEYIRAPLVELEALLRCHVLLDD